jgi:hypothetical protein
VHVPEQLRIGVMVTSICPGVGVAVGSGVAVAVAMVGVLVAPPTTTVDVLPQPSMISTAISSNAGRMSLDKDCAMPLAPLRRTGEGRDAPHDGASSKHRLGASVL